MDAGHGGEELTPGQQVLNSLPAAGTPRTYAMSSTQKHQVTRGRYLTSNDQRGYIPVYEYPVGGQWIMLDAEDGYVLWTAIWKALGNAKADVVRMLDNMPELTPHIRRVRGGYLKIQGTWMKYEIAEDFARRVAYSIREDLIPLFGESFPETCLTPDQPGYGNILPGGRRRKTRATAARKAPSKNVGVSSYDDYQPSQAPAPPMYPDAPPNQEYPGHERSDYGAPPAHALSRSPYAAAGPSAPVPHFTQSPMYASQQQQQQAQAYYAQQAQAQYYDQIHATSDAQHPHHHHQQQHPHPYQHPYNSLASYTAGTYHHPGLPPASVGPGPSRASSSLTARSAAGGQQGRYEPYPKPNHLSRQGSSNDLQAPQSQLYGSPYTRLPAVDYSRIRLSPTVNTPLVAVPAAGWSNGTPNGARPANGNGAGPGAGGGARTGMIVDPSLVGAAPPDDNGNLTAGLSDRAPPRLGGGEGVAGEREERPKSDSSRVPTPAGEGITNGAGTGTGNGHTAEGQHEHAYATKLPISSARDDANS